jgi:hypothetical protein
MLEAIRKFFRTKAGMGVAAVLVLLGLGVVVVTVKGVMTNEGADLSAHRMFMDAKTGLPYPFEIDLKTPIPAPAPSGGNTGYPGEACYWTKDGKPKAEPTWVLLNKYKGSNEPTFCPDCGRLVVGHNPPAAQGAKPPPTKQEYKGGFAAQGR